MKLLRLAVLCALAASCGSSRGVPEGGVALPEFSMSAIGPKGEAPFRRADLLGSVWVADFVFTRCSGPCPLMTQRMKELAAELPPAVRLLTVTVDPEGDTPERLRAYARRFDADQNRWVFLRGELKATYDLLYAGFRLPISIDPALEPGTRVSHSTRFVLIDKAGAVRGYYDALTDFNKAALVRDARRLLEVGS